MLFTLLYMFVYSNLINTDKLKITYTQCKKSLKQMKLNNDRFKIIYTRIILMPLIVFSVQISLFAMYTSIMHSANKHMILNAENKSCAFKAIINIFIRTKDRSIAMLMAETVSKLFDYCHVT